MANHQLHVISCVLDFLREVLSEHIVDFNDESEGDEGLDDHRKFFCLADGNLQDDFSVNRGYDLHEANEDIDEPSSLSSFGCFNIF